MTLGTSVEWALVELLDSTCNAAIYLYLNSFFMDIVFKRNNQNTNNYYFCDWFMKSETQ